MSKVKTAEEIALSSDPLIIKWTETLRKTLIKGKKLKFDESKIREVLYRPFTKLWLYEDSDILSRCKTISAMFPKGQKQESFAVTGGSNAGRVDSLVASEIISDLAGIGPGLGGESYTEAILVTAPTTISIPSLLATRKIADVIATGGSQAVKVFPRKV